ncbi:MAG: hypothetical protein EOO16_17420 [Chitinophagaceae bacterium]|nr:MAG: hypothetical protein EOO16_17420 [Chitinophagaceae bacterium]
MINIKELRVGNYVLVDNEICPVTFVNDDPGFEDSPSVGYRAAAGPGFRTAADGGLLAVPLSDDILARLDYVFHPHFKLWQHPKQPGTYSLELDRDHTALDFGHRPIVKELKHLHTLQNLYFALSGEELKLAAPAIPAMA